MINLYVRYGFIIRVILMEMEFEKGVEILEKFEVNIVSAIEHVVEVERTFRTVNKHGRGIANKLP